jgi:thiamine biosynthesis lipoprotein
LITADSVASVPIAMEAQAAWDRVNASMSNWVESSELSRINRTAGAEATEVDKEVAAVLSRALVIGEESGGAFDVTVEPLVRLWGFLGGTPHVPAPEEIEALLGRIGLDQIEFDRETRVVRFLDPDLKVDFGGIAKGYGVDMAMEAVIRAEEAKAPGRPVHAMINLSGNIRTVGSPVGREFWRVGVRDPRDRMTYFGTLRLQESAMATSGNYEQFVAEDGKQYGHILDPRTGWPTDRLLSATVLTTSAMDADGWATALYVLGPAEAMRIVAGRNDLRAVLIEPGAEGERDIVWVDKRLQSAFELEVAAQSIFEMRTF